MLSMLITTLLSAEVSMMATVLWALLAGWYMGSSLEIGAYFLTTGLTGAMLVRDVRRSGEFFVAAFWTSVIGLATIIAFKLLNHGYNWLGLGTYTAAVLVSAALAAALTLGSLSALGRLFGATTGINLLEISHPNHPLLRRLMQEAPGTFHHSMMIGTLAERAAEQIGADPLLVRIAAYFHDVGKLSSPTTFAENQIGMGNVHETLEPRESVDLIMQHVYEGVRLARQYHLPEVLEDGIWQHHGTTLVSFFYQQAVAMNGPEAVRMEDYRYPGPKPQTREMAILMLADVVEAAVRASPGVDANQIRAIIHRLGQDRLQDGQFDECNLTLRDLAVIEESFATVLQGLSHPRVQYPAPVPAVSNG
jgi:putative nucleotidyltransferase with HDIG domain